MNGGSLGEGEHAVVVDERQSATLPRAANAPQWWHSTACLALICCALLVSFLG